MIAQMDRQDQMEYDVGAARAIFIQKMRTEGHDIVLPDDNQLQLDLDTDAHWSTFKRSWPIFEREYPGSTFKLTFSRHGNRHVHIDTTFDMTHWERIAWQGALGSDPVRELLSCVRHHQGVPDPVLLVAPGGDITLGEKK